MRVRIPSPLRSYTAQATWVEIDAGTINDVLDELERRFPGIRFRMIDEQDRLRRHMRIFVGDEMATDLAQPLAATDEVTIVQALSGG